MYEDYSFETQIAYICELLKHNNMTTVKAKFTCSSVIDTPYKQKVANFHAVYSQDGQNKDYSAATPSGNLSIVIDNETPASTFFEQGKDYYLTFEEVSN